MDEVKMVIKQESMYEYLSTRLLNYDTIVKSSHTLGGSNPMAYELLTDKMYFVKTGAFKKGDVIVFEFEDQTHHSRTQVKVAMRYKFEDYDDVADKLVLCGVDVELADVENAKFSFA